MSTSPNSSEQDPRPSSSPSSNSSRNTWLIVGAVGCGCLTLGVVVVGILAAIALPSFLNQANKARQSEATAYAGTILRGQQAYYLDRKAFADNIDELELGIPTTSPNYNYAVEVQPGGKSVWVTATSQRDTLKSYSGGVFVLSADTSNATTITQLCESSQVTTTPPSMPTLDAASGTIQCPPDSQPRF